MMHLRNSPHSKSPLVGLPSILGVTTDKKKKESGKIVVQSENESNKEAKEKDVKEKDSNVNDSKDLKDDDEGLFEMDT